MVAGGKGVYVMQKNQNILDGHAVPLAVPLAQALNDLVRDMKASQAVPDLVDCLADLCLRAGVNNTTRLHLAQLAIEMITERLDAAGCFEGGSYD
jgi:hypothetical protein